MLQFIPDKINPPSELPRVARARLFSTLRESLASCNSTIIHGRAGSGKDDARGRLRAPSSPPRGVVGARDAPDCELSVFFRYLCATLAAQRPGFGQKTLERMGEQLVAGDVPLLVEYFVYELLESAEPLLIVVDDLHLVYDAEWMVPFFPAAAPAPAVGGARLFIGQELHDACGSGVGAELA